MSKNTYSIMNPLRLSLREAGPIVKQCFPQYRGRRFFLHNCEEKELSGTYWDGGSRSYYKGFNLTTGRVCEHELNCAPRAFGGNSEGVGVKLTPEFVLVEHAYSGTYQTIRFWVHPDAMPKMRLEGGMQ